MITLTVIVPQLVRFVRPYFAQGIIDYPLADVDLDSGDEPHLETSNHLDVYIAMTGCVLLGICTVFAAMSSTMLALLICKTLLTIVSFACTLTGMIQAPSSSGSHLCTVQQRAASSWDVLMHSSKVHSLSRFSRGTVQ